jgi:hypothetical protein
MDCAGTYNKLTNSAVAKTEGLTALNRVLLEELIVPQLVEKFHALYEAQKFITV